MRHIFTISAVFFLLTVYSIHSTAQPPRPSAVDARASYVEAHRVWLLERDGKQIVWFENGIKKSEGGMVQGKRSGDWNFWYENGKPKGSGPYTAGAKNGIWKYFFETGALEAQGLYRDDRREGAWNFFYPNGTKRLEGSYTGGLRQGVWINYYETGRVFFKGEYRDGLASGAWEYYFQNGQLNQKGEYQNETRVGAWTVCIFPSSPCQTENFGPVNVPRESGVPLVSDPTPRVNNTRNPGQLLDSMEQDSVPEDVPPSVRGDWDR